MSYSYRKLNENEVKEINKAFDILAKYGLDFAFRKVMGLPFVHLTPTTDLILDDKKDELYLITGRE